MRKVSFLVLSLILAGCANQDNQQVSEKEMVGYADNQMIDGSKTQLAVDWVGTYRGEMPCADCSGIKTTLILKENGHYQLNRDYVDADTVSEEKGTFKWINGGPDLVLYGEDGENSKVFVGEGYVDFYNADGSKPTGPTAKFYKLLKD